LSTVPGARILVVDDEPQLRRSMRLILSGHDYDVALAATGEAALEEFARRRPDLVLLDLMLPGIDGLEVCRRIRERSKTAIVVLSARGDEQTKVAALDLGADDYVTKPFGAQELLARVRVALRHSTGVAGERYAAGDLVVDIFRRAVTINGQPVPVTPREYDVLKFFVTNADRVLTHTMILREVWGAEYAAETQYLRNIVLALRRKLEADPSHPKLLITEPGIGYRFCSEPS
jgi:two-component system KDP operon response regulator KdpE